MMQLLKRRKIKNIFIIELIFINNIQRVMTKWFIYTCIHNNYNKIYSQCSPRTTAIDASVKYPLYLFFVRPRVSWKTDICLSVNCASTPSFPLLIYFFFSGMKMLVNYLTKSLCTLICSRSLFGSESTEKS